MPTPVEVKADELEHSLAGSTAGKISAAIVRSLSLIPSEQTVFLSYASLGKLANIENGNPELLRSIAHLSSPRFKVLRPFFVFVCEDGTEQIISSQEWRDANKNGFLVDRQSGAQVRDFRRSTYPYFSLTEEFQSLLRTPNG